MASVHRSPSLISGFISTLFTIGTCLLPAWTASDVSAAPVRHLPAVRTESTLIKPAQVPAFPREFRGVWVATVGNIDWPSTTSLSVEQQKAEVLAILDKAVEVRLNAIVLQVRPACDALYDSRLEPWSEFLTGEQGKAPEPRYDPLTYWVEESHKRGLELHAWFNPYRARLLRKDAGTTSPIGTGAPRVTSDLHVSRSKPDLVLNYGKYQWMDPGEKATADHSLAVIMDVVRRYDIDGVHMDDYFYPYPIQYKQAKGDKKPAVDIPFPDDVSYGKYLGTVPKGIEPLSRPDWRRSCVNDFVHRLYLAVKAEKPHVKVGLSPFGIWKPGFPEDIKGFSQFDKLYADARLWLNEGWVDYWTPQLYWKVSQLPQSYPVLLRWWMDENKKDRHVWPGLFTSKVNEKPTTSTDNGGISPTAFSNDEIVNQIVLTRFQEGAGGNVHFSMKAFLEDPSGLNERLTTPTGVYAQQALVPATPWLGTAAPPPPSVELDPGNPSGAQVRWSTGESVAPAEKTFVWAIATHTGDAWRYDVHPLDETTMTLHRNKDGVAPDLVAVTAVSRLGNESRRAVLVLPQPVAESDGKTSETAAMIPAIAPEPVASPPASHIAPANNRRKRR